MAKPIKTLELRYLIIQFLTKWLNSSLHSHSHHTVRLRGWKWAVHSGGGRFSIPHPLTSLSYYLESKLLLVIRRRIPPFFVSKLAQSNRRNETTSQVANRSKETLTPGRQDDGSKRRSDTKKRRNNETTIWTFCPRLDFICTHPVLRGASPVYFYYWWSFKINFTFT